MRTRVLVAAGLVSLAITSLFAGCRAVVGVEDLHLASDASTDAGTPDADVSDSGSAVDATDALVRSDVDIIAEGCSNGDCRRCCKQAFPQQNKALEDKARAGQCICAGPGTCAQECAATVCASQPSPADGTCGPCMDDRLTSNTAPPCKAARADCKSDPSCAPIAICLEACH